MRLPVVVALGLALAACSPAGDKGADGAPAAEAVSGGDLMPRPKIGKWNMTMDIAGMPQKQSVAVCLDQKMLDEMKGYAQSDAAATCSETSTKREGAAFVTRAVCESGGSRSIIVTRAEGNFDSRYTVETSITSDPPGAAGTMTTSTVAEFMGPC